MPIVRGGDDVGGMHRRLRHRSGAQLKQVVRRAVSREGLRMAPAVQSGVEVQQGRAVGGRALGEDGDVAAGVEQRGGFHR